MIVPLVVSTACPTVHGLVLCDVDSSMAELNEKKNIRNEIRARKEGNMVAIISMKFVGR